MEDENSKLDLTSPNFDASLALSVDKISLPVQNVEPFDSITEYFKIIDKKPDTTPQTSKQLTNQEIKEQRRQRLKAMTQHVPEKDETEIRQKSQRHLRNVVTYMENSNKVGPLGLLYKCMKERIKIKVWTRNYKHIRGICTGFVTAYDKHWNLALSDVDESFVLYHKRKSPATGDEKTTEMRKIIPQQNTICVQSTSKMQTCQRHVNQLFIRGENIVIISVCSPFAASSST